MSNAKEVVKRNIASMQVLKTLQVLLEGNYTMAEIIQKLNEKEKEPIFNNSVVSKYINTCRYCGFKILKIHNKYFIVSMPFGIDLSSTEMDLLEKIQSTGREMLSIKNNKVLTQTIDNIGRYSNKQITRVEKNSVDEILKIFEKAVANNRMVRLMFKNRMMLDCIPVAIEMRKGRKHFNVIYQDKSKYVLADRVSGLTILNSKYAKEDEENMVFKITGGLASRYDLRENEKIISQNLPESIVVASDRVDCDELLLRLMRYDTLCEVITKNPRQKMKKIIDDTLANYGE